MVDWLWWMIPVSLFWPVAALYLGGMPIHVHGGGGARQVIGLLVAYVAFLVVWWLLRMGLDAALPGTLAVIIATIASAIAVPFLARGAYRLVGIHAHRAERWPAAPASSRIH